MKFSKNWNEVLMHWNVVNAQIANPVKAILPWIFDDWEALIKLAEVSRPSLSYINNLPKESNGDDSHSLKSRYQVNFVLCIYPLSEFSLPSTFDYHRSTESNRYFEAQNLLGKLSFEYCAPLIRAHLFTHTCSFKPATHLAILYADRSEFDRHKSLPTHLL